MVRASQIQLDESLPHGTREGYQAGCQGSHCPGVERLGMSCRQASIRYASDLSYRRRIDGGLSPEAIWAEDQLEAAPAGVSDGSRVDGYGNGYAAPTVTVADSVPNFEVFAKEPKRPGRPPSPHGTDQRWKKGCRENCPGGPDGVTCTDAHTATLKAKPWVPTDVIPAEAPESTGPRVRAEGLLTDLADAREELASVRVLLAERDAELEQARSDFEALDERVREQAQEHGRVVADYRLRNEMLMRELEERDVAQQLTSTPVQGQVELTGRPASLKVMPIGGGAMVEYDGAGRIELDFADGELKHAAVSGR